MTLKTTWVVVQYVWQTLHNNTIFKFSLNCAPVLNSVPGDLQNHPPCCSGQKICIVIDFFFFFFFSTSTNTKIDSSYTLNGLFIPTVMWKSVKTDTVLCSSSHQEMESISPSLGSRCIWWLTLANRKLHMWGLRHSRLGIKRPYGFC